MRRQDRSRFPRRGTSRSAWGASLLALLVGSAGCGRQSPPTPDAAGLSPTPEGDYRAGTCSVSGAEVRRWFAAPRWPADVASQDDCEMFTFAWQELAYLVQPIAGSQIELQRWISDEELFSSDGEPDLSPSRRAPDALPSRLLRKASGVPGLRRGGAEAQHDLLAASNVPLVDRDGRNVRFSVLTDATEAEHIRRCDLYRSACFDQTSGSIRLPYGSAELKLAWRISQACRPGSLDDAQCQRAKKRFLLARSTVDGEAVMLELLGIHIIHKTPTHPEWLWATFEHRDNAPDCSRLDAEPPEGGWTLYDPACEERQATDPAWKSEYCQANNYCTPCPKTLTQAEIATAEQLLEAFDLHDWQVPDTVTCTPYPHVIAGLYDPTCVAPPIPAQVCREASLEGPIREVNDQVREALVGLPGDPALWANYILVGVLWKEDGEQGADDAGVLKLTNTTMETFLQQLTFDPTDPDNPKKEVFNTGCLVCHGPDPLLTTQRNGPMADYSFIFYSLEDPGGCSSDQPAACTEAEGSS